MGAAAAAYLASTLAQAQAQALSLSRASGTASSCHLSPKPALIEFALNTHGTLQFCMCHFINMLRAWR